MPLIQPAGPALCRASAPLRRHVVISRPARSSAPTSAEAGAWADVLVRRRLLHTAVLAPTGQWLIQQRPDGPVHVLSGPAAVVDLVATIQHRIHSTRPASR